jgi:hypothetical protein
MNVETTEYGSELTEIYGHGLKNSPPIDDGKACYCLWRLIDFEEILIFSILSGL